MKTSTMCWKKQEKVGCCTWLVAARSPGISLMVGNKVLPVDRAASIQREMHMRDSHPYAPFPVARLEAAVAAVPLEAYEPAERSMTTFGRAYRFR